MKRVSSSRINTGCSYCHCCHHVSPRRKALPRPRLQASRKKASLKNSSTELARDSDTNQSGPRSLGALHPVSYRACFSSQGGGALVPALCLGSAIDSL